MTGKKYLTISRMATAAMFSALIAVGAFIKITIPLEPFPMHFTMQWFFVLLAGFLLEGKLAGISVGVYLLIGLSGVPIFASGGGLSYLIRPTFGYLLGFLVAATLIGVLRVRCRVTSYLGQVVLSLVGLLAYYGVGVFYYYMICRFIVPQTVTWEILLFNCFLLTVFGDAVLCIVAVTVSRRLRAMMPHSYLE